MDREESKQAESGENPSTDNISHTRRFLLIIKDRWHRDPVKFAFWTGFSILAMVVVISLALEYSYRPRTCIFCHEMKPAHETWGRSSHGPVNGGDDDCLGCHAAPGFGSKIKAKLGGLVFLWNHILENYDDDIKAEMPVYCVRSGCHTKPWEMDRGSKIRVNHALHISKGYACVACHDRIAHGPDPAVQNLPGMKDFCFPCHNDEIASRSDCQYCHIYQDALLRGKGGEGIPEGYPSVHQTLQLKCVDCHTEGCVAQPVQTCLECHPESYISKQEAEMAWFSLSMERLEDGIPRLAEAIKKAEDVGQDISQISGIYNLVKDVYTFLKADGSRGAHNVAYARSLLKNAMNRLNYAYIVLGQAS